MNYVIIGNSTAGIGTVEGIRKHDKLGEIIIISNEKHHTYSRPLISYLLYGKTTEEKMKYRKDSFYEDNNAKLVFGNVLSIDDKKKTVNLENGESISYDKLLVGAGSKPFVPPMQGLESVKNKFTFMSLDDAKALEAIITSETRVLIIGAGLIGLKAAEGLSKRVASITVVDMATRVLPSILDEEGSKIVEDHLVKSNIKCILGTTTKELFEEKAILSNGDEINFDVLIVAVGVRPNTELIKDIGGQVNRGIQINTKCETSINDIYSAGDCTESYDITTGENKILAILPNAYMQGEVAGINMAGGNKEYTNAIPMNAMSILGLHMITAGSYDGEQIITKAENSYKKLVVRDGLLVGYIMIGEVNRAGIYTSLIRDKVQLDSVDFEVLKNKPQLIAFSKQVRMQKLGGVKNDN
jgi:NAD(P)H-nitrite reductase large subunit